MGRPIAGPPGDWYPEPSICPAWKLDFFGWEDGEVGPFAQVTWGNLTTAETQPGVAAELRVPGALRSSPALRRTCCVTSSKSSPLFGELRGLSATRGDWTGGWLFLTAFPAPGTVRGRVQDALKGLLPE